MKIRGLPSLADATVDASKALRHTPVDDQGRELVRPPADIASFLAGWSFAHSGVVAAPAQFLGIVNTSPTTIMRVRAIRVIVRFDGTAPGAQGRRYYWIRTIGQINAGGTTIAPTKKRTSSAASGAALSFNAAGITGPTGVGDPMWVMGLSIDTTGKFQPYEYQRHAGLRAQNANLELRYNEGLGLFNGDATIAGLGICGYVEWDEVAA